MEAGKGQEGSGSFETVAPTTQYQCDPLRASISLSLNEGNGVVCVRALWEVTKDRMPAKCLGLSGLSYGARVCYYLQQTGKPVGNPGASGKLGVVGWPSRTEGAGRGRGGAGRPR